MVSTALSPAIPFARAEPEPADSDAALMARVRAGDLDAFEPLVRRHEKRLFGYFLNLVGDPDAAADLAQETFCRVYRAAARYRESGRFEAWLFRIAANLVRSRRRRQDQRAFEVSLEAVEAAPAVGDAAAGGPESAAWRAELRGALRAALRQVPADFREAVLLRDLEGWSYPEIAEMLGVKEGTVKSRAHRGRKLLRRLLAPSFEGISE